MPHKNSQAPKTTVGARKKAIRAKVHPWIAYKYHCWDFTAACLLLRTKILHMAIDLNLPPADVDPFDLNENPLLEDEQAAAVEDEQAAAVEDEQVAAQVDVQAAAQEDVQAATHHFDLNIPVFDEHEEIHGGNHVLLYIGCIFCF
jgi:hypothetical protein